MERLVKIRSGAAPATIAAADTGIALATMTLPIPSGGTWEGGAQAYSLPAHFRVYDPPACVRQGTVTLTGGGGDMEVDNVSFLATQSFRITKF